MASLRFGEYFLLLSTWCSCVYARRAGVGEDGPLKAMDSNYSAMWGNKEGVRDADRKWMDERPELVHQPRVCH